VTESVHKGEDGDCFRERGELGVPRFPSLLGWPS